MRLIKLAILSVFFLFLVATFISLLIPSHIRISKATNIAAPKDSIFERVKDTLQWRNWHPAFMPQNTAKKFQTITIRTLDINDSAIVMALNQGSKAPVINGWQVYHTAADSLTLQWYMDFELKWYPWQKFGSMFYENTYGVMMEQGLANLKKLIEK